MFAYILSASKVEGNILVNVLKKQGHQTSQISMPSEMDKGLREKGDTLIFVDWDNPDLDRGLVQDLGKTMGNRLFIVSANEAEPQLQSIVQGGESQFIPKPIEPTIVKSKVGTVRKVMFSKMKLDAKVINAFIQAVTNTYETMIGITPKREKVYILEPSDVNTAADSLFDISGVMGLSGDYSGSVVVSFPVKLALKSVAMMLGEDEKPSLDSEVRDCVGEIINIVSGQAKATLSTTDYKFELALPTVIVGKGHKVHIHEDSPTLVIMFSTEGENFILQVNIRPANG